MTTTGAPTPTVSWTAPDGGQWTRETAHFTGIVSVPFRDEFEAAFADGFRSGLAPLGVPLSHLELRHLHGWPFVSFFVHDAPRKAGKEPPAWVLKVLTRLHPGFRRRTKVAAAALAERRPQSIVAGWEAERDTWIQRNLAVQRVDTDALDDAALADHLGVVRTLMADGLRRHFELVPGCIPLGDWLVAAGRWELDPVDARRVVMFGTPVHAEARARLERIATALGDARPADLEGVRAHSAEAAAALDDYLDHHGGWGSEDSVDAPTVADHPDLILASIDAYRVERPSPAEGVDEIVERLRARVPAADRAEFDRALADARRSYRMLDDNSGITSAWVVGIAGMAARRVGHRLVALGRLGHPDDVWALSVTDLQELLRGTSPLTPDDVAARVAEHRAQGELDPPLFLNGEPGPPPDPSVFPPPVARLMAAIGAFLGDKFNDARQPAGIGRVKVRGRAVVTRSASEAFDRLQPGDILVTTATTPSYNSVLPMVGGLVVSEGGPGCHAAVMARELGLTAVVGLSDALATIPDGAMVEIDPQRATVSVVG